jgi:hypothetical protein
MSYTPGQLPLGAVIATFPALTNAYQCSATTTPDAKGFVLCQGQTLVAGSMAGAVVPDINAQVFLRGNSTSGATAVGNSTQSLTATNLPALTSTGTTTGTGSTVAANTGAGTSHSHGASGLSNSTSSVSGTVGGSDGTHTHTITDPGHTHAYTLVTYAQDAASGAVRFAISGTSAVSTGGNTTGISINSTSSGHGHSHSLTAAAQSISGNTAAESAHTHSIPSLTVNSGISVSVTASGTSGGASGTAFAIEPKYINAVYLMRVN